MSAPRFDMIVPGIFATGLASKTFLPSVESTAIPCLDKIVAYGDAKPASTSSTFAAVSDALEIDANLIADTQAGLCWRAEFDVDVPAFVSIGQPVTLSVGRVGLTVGEMGALSRTAMTTLCDILKPIVQDYDLAVAIGPRYKTLFVFSDSALDVVFPSLSDAIGQPLREVAASGSDGQRMNRLRTDVEMALHEALHNEVTAQGSEVMPNSLWLSGAKHRLAPVSPYAGPVTHLSSPAALYQGLAAHLGLVNPEPTRGSIRRLYVDSSGESYVIGRQVEQWYHWLVAADQRWQREISALSGRHDIYLVDPLGAHFAQRPKRWPWRKPQTFFQRVNALADQN